MKKRCSVLVLCAIICILILSVMNVSANDNVKVFIDNEKILFDVEPKIINGRTMVPMRKIFEYLGADVKWYQYDRSIVATCGHLKIEMQIDNNKMYVNNNCITLDSPPVIKDGRTLIPLRAVAEAFNSDVEWKSDTRTVNIKTPYPRNNYQNGYSQYHIVSPSYQADLDLSIKDNILTVSGSIKDKDVTGLSISFPGNSEDFYQEDISVKVNEKFEVKIDLSKRKVSDENTISMVMWKDKLNSSEFGGEILINTDQNRKNYYFEKTLHWENNKKFFSNWVNPIGYLNSKVDAKLVSLSNSICKDADDDYDKVLKIHDWVADNIYYDYDKQDLTTEPMGVYEKKRTVCGGYANLTQALIQAQGIPCIFVRGYGHREAHAWNQAYVDDRWINLDTTWDSSNTYKNGVYIKGRGVGHNYFDISDIMFSCSHKIEMLHY